MVSSRDGQQWRRADPGPDGQRPKLIPRGPTLWDAMMIHTSTHPLLVDDTLHLYYQGDSCSHHGAVCVKPKTPTSIGLATLRRDGLGLFGARGCVCARLRHDQGVERSGQRLVPARELQGGRRVATSRAARRGIRNCDQGAHAGRLRSADRRLDQPNRDVARCERRSARPSPYPVLACRRG